MTRFTLIFVQISWILWNRLPINCTPWRPLLNWTDYQIPRVLSRDEKSIRFWCCWRFLIVSKEWNLQGWKKTKLSTTLNVFLIVFTSSMSKLQKISTLPSDTVLYLLGSNFILLCDKCLGTTMDNVLLGRGFSATCKPPKCCNHANS
jgi:hypothetical protein